MTTIPPTFLPFLPPYSAPTLFALSSSHRFISFLLCFVSWSFFPFVILCEPPPHHRRPKQKVLILGDSQATFDQHLEHYPHPFIDPRLLDLRLTQPPSKRRRDSPGEQLSQSPLPQPRSESRDTSLSLDQFILNNANSSPAERLIPELQPQRLHDHIPPQLAPQRPDVPPNICNSCQKSFPKSYQLKYIS